MSGELFRQRGLLGAVFGTGIFIGVIGLSVVLRIMEYRKKRIEARNMNRLNFKADETGDMGEIVSARRLSHLSSSRLSLQSCSSRSSKIRRSGLDTDDDMYSALDSDGEDFFDINSDDESYFTTHNDTASNDENLLNLFEEVDALLKGGNEDKVNALELLRQQEAAYSENPNFLWRLAKAHQMQATAFGAKKDVTSKKNFVIQGLTYAGKALAMDPSNSDAHKWYAILVGMQGEFLSVKEKIQNGYTFQKHLLEALESKPNDYSLHHLLGRFKFEIANLSWIEKKVASTLFAELPAVSLQDAIRDFEKSENLNPVPWKENRLFLAKCYIGTGNYPEAVEWLLSAKKIRPQTHDDVICDEECEYLLSKYQ